MTNHRHSDGIKPTTKQVWERFYRGDYGQDIAPTIESLMQTITNLRADVATWQTSSRQFETLWQSVLIELDRRAPKETK